MNLQGRVVPVQPGTCVTLDVYFLMPRAWLGGSISTACPKKGSSAQFFPRLLSKAPWCMRRRALILFSFTCTQTNTMNNAWLCVWIFNFSITHQIFLGCNYFVRFPKGTVDNDYSMLDVLFIEQVVPLMKLGKLEPNNKQSPCVCLCVYNPCRWPGGESQHHYRPCGDPGRFHGRSRRGWWKWSCSGKASFTFLLLYECMWTNDGAEISDVVCI